MKEKKERIKDRMLKTAARLWGYPDAEVETSFDPVVQLLLEACASELEKISGEVDVSHARLVERLAQIMMPEPITSSQPAYGILHAMATEAVADIHADHQFYHHTKTGTHTRDLFFRPSPVIDFSVGRCSTWLLATNYTKHVITGSKSRSCKDKPFRTWPPTIYG